MRSRDEIGPPARPPRRFRGLPRRRLLGVEVPVATTLRARLLGLAGLRRDHAGPGLLIPRCRSVHTFGMRFPIEVAFLDAAGRVLSRRRLPPCRVAGCRGAAAVLEVAASPSPPGGEIAAPGA